MSKDAVVGKEPLTDEALMVAASKDDLEAFESLVRRHQNRVYRVALQMLGNEEDAWDVSQDIFIKVYNARHTYVTDAKFTTWLYRITNNAVIDRIRQLRRQQVSSLTDAPNEPVSEDPTTHHHLALEEVKGQMSEALANLTERQRGMVILKYYEGCSVKEIAEVFDCAAGTVKATLFQAIQHLRKGLAQAGVFNAEVAS
jgi:RNA polymerase sigma-70 factor (ECF subfamily)